MDEWELLRPLTGKLHPLGKRMSRVNRNDMIVEYPQHMKAAKELAERTIVRLQMQHEKETDLTKSDRYIGVLNNLLMSMAKLGTEMRQWLKIQEKHKESLDITGKLDALFKFLTSNKVTVNERAAFYRRCREFEDTRSGARKITLSVQHNSAPERQVEPADDK